MPFGHESTTMNQLKNFFNKNNISTFKVYSFVCVCIFCEYLKWKFENTKKYRQ